MIAFIDTEVNPQTKKVADYGAVRDDGAVLHSHSKADFDAFVSKCDTVCGHNIINHDLKYTSLRGNLTIVDTLFLSPLLFPKRPYHHLVKDDKLQVDELNNPVNDSMKARDLFNDEVAAWNQLTDNRKEIYYYLLNETQEFGGFFKYIGYSPNISWISVIFASKPDLRQLILKEYDGKVCSHADFETLVKQYPIELAYSLAVIGADDIFSITPAWVIRNYPQVVNVMNMLCNTSCGDCEYCHQRLDAHYGLKEFFGYDEFRIFDGVPMQQQAVESAIRRESLLTIFPTGGGKSLTFQLPALMAGRNTHGLTVVISPLQSLMKDQVDNLAARGISDAVTINGLLDPIERATAIEQVADGTANLLYTGMFLLWNDYRYDQVQIKRCINPGYTAVGTYYGAEGDVYIFASIKKDVAEGMEHLNYKDKFLEPSVFQWECKANISDGELNKLKTSKYTHLFIRKIESENGITLPFTYVGIGHLDNPRQSQNEERKRTFIFDIHMEEELPDYLQYDFGLTN